MPVALARPAGVAAIPSALHNVDLPARRPAAVRVVARDQPDGRPQPVAAGHPGADFEAAEPERLFGLDQARRDGRQDAVACAVGEVEEQLLQEIQILDSYNIFPPIFQQVQE